MNFSNRSNEQEIMDREIVTMDELSSAYKDINRSNRMLGGYFGTYVGLMDLWEQDPVDSISLLDVGCGDGGMLRYLASRFRRKGIAHRLYGLDLNHQAIELARRKSTDFPEIEYFETDILGMKHGLPRYDYVICTLTMHHFGNSEIPQLLKKCQDMCKKAIVINDLHRSKTAYYLFKIFSAIFIKSAVAKNDGLVSIKKGFVKAELENFAQLFRDWDHLIKWRWAFRYVWVMENNRLSRQ